MNQAVEVRDEAEIIESRTSLRTGPNGGGAADFRVDKTPLEVVGEYSPPAKKPRAPKVKKPLTAREIASEKVVDMTAFKAAGDYSPPAVFDADKWKRSRVKKGYLIARISGYDVVEGEYGVHYLKVIHRDSKTGKKKTSGDYSLYEHAGFSTWQTMQKTGKLVKEKKRNERINENRADAS